MRTLILAAVVLLCAAIPAQAQCGLTGCNTGAFSMVGGRAVFVQSSVSSGGLIAVQQPQFLVQQPQFLLAQQQVVGNPFLFSNAGFGGVNVAVGGFGGGRFIARGRVGGINGNVITGNRVVVRGRR